MLSMNLRSYALASMIVMTTFAAFAMGGRPQADDDAVSARIQPVAKLEMAPMAPKGGAVNRTGEQMYKAICFACHAPGAAILTSPKIGDKAAWAPRIALGLNGLLKSAIAGKNAMPPKGGAADASEEEMKRAIAYMANQSGASFK